MVKISIIIAVYNRPDFLEKIFVSLLNQTVPDFEIVIADDGSGPSIAAMIRRYQEQFHAEIKHVRHEDDGFRKTVIINTAIQQASGEYLIFIDGDCILHHRFVEFHYQRKQPSVVLTGRRVMLTEDISKRISVDDIRQRRIERVDFWYHHSQKDTRKHGFFIPGIFFIRNAIGRKYRLLGSNFSAFKSDYLKINGYDERIVGRGLEDDNLGARFMLAHVRLKSIVFEALQYHMYHTADPIPHTQEIIDKFWFPESFFTPFGIIKERNVKVD